MRSIVVESSPHVLEQREPTLLGCLPAAAGANSLCWSVVPQLLQDILTVERNVHHLIAAYLRAR